MTKLRYADPDDVPEINVSTEPCGHPKNPHTVRSVNDRTCSTCGEPLTRVAAEPDPARDCPPCPECKATVGTPASPECGVERGRWHGPIDATLFCPACGTGWIGSPEHVEQAWSAWRAYEREMAAGG